MQDQELKFRNRINEAQIEGGDLGAAREMLEIYKEQIVQINKLEDAYRAAGYTDEEIQARRIAARKGVQQAEQNIADIQLKTTHQALGAAAQVAGGFSAMFDALGGEGERYAEFSKALAIFEVALQQAQAIAELSPMPLNILFRGCSRTDCKQYCCGSCGHCTGYTSYGFGTNA